MTSYNEIKPYIKNLFIQYGFDYDNSKSINDGHEELMALLISGANENQDYYSEPFNAMKSNDRKTIINNFMKNVDAGNKQRILENCYNNLDNAYEKIVLNLMSAMSDHYSINETINKMQNNCEIQDLKNVKDYIQNIIVRFSAISNIIEKTSGNTPSTITSLLNLLYVKFHFLQDFIKKIEEEKLENNTDFIKTVIDMNDFSPYDVMRNIPLIQMENEQMTNYESNALDLQAICAQYKKTRSEDLEKIEKMKNNPNQIQEKDILDIYENTNQLTIDVIRRALTAEYKGETTELNDLNFDNIEYSFSVEKKYIELVPGKKILVIEVKKIKDGNVAETKYIDMQGRTVSR